MATMYEDLMALFGEIGERLAHLTDLAKEKRAAVEADDLLKLNEILNEEQAESLAFRSLDRKRDTMLQELGLSGTALSSLEKRCPPEMRERAAQCSAQLREHYQTYRTAADAARKRLEQSIGEIDAVVSGVGGAPLGGPGYSGSEANLPRNMKTDFRA